MNFRSLITLSVSMIAVLWLLLNLIRSSLILVVICVFFYRYLTQQGAFNQEPANADRRGAGGGRQEDRRGAGGGRQEDRRGAGGGGQLQRNHRRRKRRRHRRRRRRKCHESAPIYRPRPPQTGFHPAKITGQGLQPSVQAFELSQQRTPFSSITEFTRRSPVDFQSMARLSPPQAGFQAPVRNLEIFRLRTPPHPHISEIPGRSQVNCESAQMARPRPPQVDPQQASLIYSLFENQEVEERFSMQEESDQGEESQPLLNRHRPNPAGDFLAEKDKEEIYGGAI